MQCPIGYINRTHSTNQIARRRCHFSFSAANSESIVSMLRLRTRHYRSRVSDACAARQICSRPVPGSERSLSYQASRYRLPRRTHEYRPSLRLSRKLVHGSFVGAMHHAPLNVRTVARFFLPRDTNFSPSEVEWTLTSSLSCVDGLVWMRACEFG
jgi:hypothetical protein